jgi:hypothetical protein
MSHVKIDAADEVMINVDQDLNNDHTTHNRKRRPWSPLHFGFGERKSSHVRPKYKFEYCWPYGSISFLSAESISLLPD